MSEHVVRDNGNLIGALRESLGLTEHDHQHAACQHYGQAAVAIREARDREAAARILYGDHPCKWPLEVLAMIQARFVAANAHVAVVYNAATRAVMGNAELGNAIETEPRGRDGGAYGLADTPLPPAVAPAPVPAPPAEPTQYHQGPEVATQAPECGELFKTSYGVQTTCRRKPGHTEGLHYELPDSANVPF